MNKFPVGTVFSRSGRPIYRVASYGRGFYLVEQFGIISSGVPGVPGVRGWLPYPRISCTELQLIATRWDIAFPVSGYQLSLMPLFEGRTS